MMRSWAKENKKWLAMGLLAIVMVLSCTVMARNFSNPNNEVNVHIMQSLDEKRDTVLTLSASSAAASAAITLLPGDAGTTIAEKLADLSGYFIVILCAIYLEKFLLTIAAASAFTLFIPIGCGLLIIFLLFPNRILSRVGCKMVAFGLLVALLVPVSVGVSDTIDRYYSDTIRQTVSVANELTDKLEGEAIENESKENSLAQNVETIVQSVTGAAQKTMKQMQNLLSAFMEAVAVMIVTSCLIPILVLLFFLWTIKMLMGVNIQQAVRSAFAPSKD